ncbi:MAG: LPS export ABC transporter ATP-binding protein [Simkaniaceae bacterium]|nr:LPS export ABC transporter ATP-binding protein [Simkaniaceae bacterium]
MEEKKPILRIQNIAKFYQDRNVVDDLSFDIYPGEVIGLLGPNGAGKTTAFYMTIGLISPDRGHIFFHEKDVTHMPIHERSKMGMGYLAQEPSIFRHLSVEENILCFLEMRPLTKEEKTEQLKNLLEELNLSHLAKKKAALLSGGERRRLEITRSLVTNPNLLLLDEPFANIDPITVSEVKALIRILKQKNISILITDHNAREIFSIVDRSFLMMQGRILATGTANELITHEDVRSRYLGENFTL